MTPPSDPPGPSTPGSDAARHPAPDPPGSTGVWRALDACANRAAEGIRVIEDVVRFLLDDLALTGEAKRLRHDLAAHLAHAGLADRVAARDVARDVGPSVGGVGALARATPTDLVAANAARAEQALRSLQELSLVVRPESAPGFEALRYRLYDLERVAAAVTRARERLAGVTLCVLVDGRADRDAFGRLVEGLLGAGVRMIQVRDKTLGIPQLADRVSLAVGLSRGRQGEGKALVIVNDRPDVALATGADGVHVGDDDLPVALARRALGPGLLVGRTAHAIEEARAAVIDGADSLGVGPCFPSSTKAFEAWAGRDFLAAVAGTVGLPAFAIGGVTLERLDGLLSLGVRRVAVAAAITGADDPPAMAARFIERLARPPEPAGSP